MSSAANPTSKQTIYDLLDDLPPEGLEAVEGFVRFLRKQAKKAQNAADAATEESAPFRYPTIPLPLASLGGLVGIMPPVGGNALAETEALYDVEPQA
jgi:hypothetical protein